MTNHQYVASHPGYEELEIERPTDQRLRLVTPSLEFAHESLAWVSDPEVSRFMGTNYSQVSLDTEIQRLQDIINNHDAYHWIVEVDEHPVGNINISSIDETSREFGVRAGKLNFFIGDKSLWGQGITTAAARAVILWAFDHGHFQMLKARVLPQNHGSLAVMRKLGFQEYGTEEYDGPDIGIPTSYRIYKLSGSR